jgi:hypothetical protein
VLQRKIRLNLFFCNFSSFLSFFLSFFLLNHESFIHIKLCVNCKAANPKESAIEKDDGTILARIKKAHTD